MSRPHAEDPEMDQDVTTMAEAPPADLAYLRMELIGKLLGAGVAPDAVPAQARKLEAYLVEGAKSAEARKLVDGVDYLNPTAEELCNR